MIKLALNTDVYLDENIKKTIQIYRGYASIRFKAKDAYRVLTFSGCKYDEEVTIKEFENYLIELENS